MAVLFDVLSLKNRYPVSTEPITRSRTLVVDDDAVMREVLLALLDMQGHEVHVVDSGDEALHRLATEPAPDFVLTDMVMPGIHGGALVEALRGAMAPSTRLVGMSGSRPQQRVLDSLDAFVLKPFGYADLEAVLQSVTAPDSPAPEQGEPGTEPESAASQPASGQVLDEAIFASLRGSFRSAQLAELYTMTLNDVETRRKRIGEFTSAGDLEAARREAHSIKGLCGMVGARQLGDLAGRVEAGTTFDVFAFHQIEVACARLRRMLDTKFANHTAPAGEHE